MVGIAGRREEGAALRTRAACAPALLQPHALPHILFVRGPSQHPPPRRMYVCMYDVCMYYYVGGKTQGTYAPSTSFTLPQQVSRLGRVFISETRGVLPGKGIETQGVLPGKGIETRGVEHGR